MSQILEPNRPRMRTQRIILVCGTFIFVLCLGALAVRLLGTSVAQEAYHLGWPSKYDDERLVSPTREVWHKGEGIRVEFTTEIPSPTLASIPMPIDFSVIVRYGDNSSRVIYSELGKMEGEFVWVADQEVAVSIVLAKYEETVAHVRVTYTRFNGNFAPIFKFPYQIFAFGVAISGGIDAYILAFEINKRFLEHTRTVPYGPVTISGFISPSHIGVPVSVSYSVDGTSWKTLETVKTDDLGYYKCVWTPPVIGKYFLKTNWEGDAHHEPAESSQTITFNLTRATTSIVVECKPQKVRPMGSTIIVGLLEPPIGDVDVLLEYALEGSAWHTISNAATSPSGEFKQPWIPPSIGTYIVRASVKGNTNITGGTGSCELNVREEAPSSISLFPPHPFFKFQYFLTLTTRMLLASLSSFSTWILFSICLLIALEAYFSHFFYAFVLGLAGSILSVFQLRIDDWIGKHPARGRLIQAYFKRSSELPSTPFILVSMVFLMSAASGLALDLPVGLVDSFTIYAYYFLVLGVGAQLVSYIGHPRRDTESRVLSLRYRTKG